MDLMIVLYVVVAGLVLAFVFRPLFVEMGEVARVSGRETKPALVDERSGWNGWDLWDGPGHERHPA